MRSNRELHVFLVYACVTSVSLAFVPHSGAGCATLRSIHHIEPSTSSISHAHRSSFTGAAVAHASHASGLKRSRKGIGGKCRRGKSLGMLFGGTDTFLGVGSPELVVILVIGYFVLGPIELFKLAKQAGVLAGQLKDIGLGTATNLGKIVEEQIEQAEKVASGEVPTGWYDPEQEYPQGEEDEYEEVILDEFGGIVYENNEPQTQVSEGEDKPFWDGWSTEKLGLDGEEGPLKEVSKFASQISGAVNNKVMEREEDDFSSAAADGEMQGWAGTDTAATAAATAAGVGVAGNWKPPTSEPGMANELENDVPAELSASLSIDEQFERLDTIAALEEERASTMQRLEAKIEEKIGSIKNELLELVDEDFQDRRAKVEQKFSAKSKAKAAAAATASAAAAVIAGASDVSTSAEANIDRTTATAGRTRGEQ